MVSRRGLMGSALALAGGAALAGCGPNGGGSGGSGGNGEAGSGKLPKRIPYEGAKPDIAAGENGIPDAFFKYPADVQSTGRMPLSTSDPVSMLLVGSPPAAKDADNPWYQLLTKQIGTDFKFTWGSWSNYGEKYQVTIASGDIPDLVMMQTVASFPKLLEAKFTDLTPFLADDAIADYPGLASFPTPSWKVPQLNGRIWGIPQPRPPAGRVLTVRNDLAEKYGVGRNPKINSGEDLLDLMKELSDEGKKHWSMGADPQQWTLPMVANMMGAPNEWAEQDGQFVHQWSTPEFRAAIEVTKKMFDDGLLHPQSVVEGAANFDWWSSGVTTLYMQAFSGYPEYAASNPDWDLAAIVLPKWDGGGPAGVHLSEAGYSSWVGISKQDSDDKVKELLKVVDYIGSPFGTKEFLEINYGIEGTHYELEGTDPVPNKDSTKADQNRSILYAGSQYKGILYVPGQEQVVKDAHAYLTEVLPGGVADASQGLYSETSVTKGSNARRKVNDIILGIIAGRNKIEEYDSAAKEFEETVGKKIAEELAEAKAAS